MVQITPSRHVFIISSLTITGLYLWALSHRLDVQHLNVKFKTYGN